MVPAAAVGVYRTRDQVASAVDELRTNAFRSADISVLFPDNIGSRTEVPERGASPLAADEMLSAHAGALVGGTLEWLFGVRALVIPGAGPFIAAGPIVDAIGSAADPDGSGGLRTVLAMIGVTPPNDERYEARIRDGGILLAVRTLDSDWSRLARAIMARTQATDIIATGDDDDPELADRTTPHLSP